MQLKQILSACAVAFVIFAGTGRCAGQSLVNGSFESGAANWNFTAGLSILGPTLGVDGSHCASLGGGDIPNCTLSQTFAVLPNSHYLVIFATAANGDGYPGRTGAVRAEVLGSDNSVLAAEEFVNISPGPLLGTNGFIKREMTFTSPSNASLATLRFTDVSASGGTAVDPMIDDVRVLYAGAGDTLGSLVAIREALNSSNLTPARLRPLVAEVQQATRALQRLSAKVQRRIAPEDAALAAQIQAQINLLLAVPSE
jgi:hypothetical protein